MRSMVKGITDMELVDFLDIAKALAIQAGDAIMKIYNTDFSVSYKQDYSPLTEADKESEAIIIAGLKAAFPQIPILSEESEDDKTRLMSEWCFIIDPLDGTKEFLKKNGEFTVNIAAVYKQKSVAGVIYAPALCALYYAAETYGAWMEKNDDTCRLKVSDRTDDNIFVVMSRSHASNLEEKLIADNGIKHIRRSGSSLKGCLIAQGDADVYYRFGPTMEWDTAAMQCIVEEAGGIMHWLDGGEMLYNREDSRNEGFMVINHRENALRI